MADESFESIPVSVLLHRITTEPPSFPLQLLRDKLLYTGEINDRDVKDLVPALVKLFLYPPSAEVELHAASCIHNLVTAAREPAAQGFRGSGILPRAAAILSLPSSIELGEECLRIMQAFSETKPTYIGEECHSPPGNMACFLNAVRHFPIAGQRLSLEVFHQVTNFFVSPLCAEYLCGLGELFTHHDGKLVADAVHTFANIASNQSDNSVIDPAAISRLVVGLHCMTDGPCVTRLVNVLAVLADSEPLAQAMLDAGIDFGLILSQTSVRSGFAELLDPALTVMLKLSIPPDGWTQPFIPRKLRGAVEFMASIASIAEQLLLDGLGSVSHCLKVVAATSRLANPNRIERFLNLVSSYALVPVVFPDVILVLRNLRDKSILERSPILAVIQSIDASALDVIGVSTAGIAPVLPISGIDNPDEFNRIVSLLPGEFAVSRALDRCADYLRGGGAANPGDLEKLFGILHELLVVSQMPPEGNPVPVPAAHFLNQQVSALLIGPGQPNPLGNFSIPLSLDFLSVEQFWNDSHGGPTFGQLDEAYHDDEELQRVLPGSEVKENNNVILGLLHRACRTPGYSRYEFHVWISRPNTRKIFSFADSVFQGYSAVCENVADMKASLPTIESVPLSLSEDRAHFVLRTFTMGIDPIFDLLAQIHERDPTINLVCGPLATHLLPHFTSLSHVLGRFTHAFAYAFRYPFVFPFAFRQLVFRLATSHMVTTVTLLNRHFFDSRETIQSNRAEIHCLVDRDNVRRDGTVVLERFGPGRCGLKVSFLGEEGIGLGPTRDFFHLFSKALSEDARLWATDRRNGIFPRPSADPHTFWLIGVMCAKALSGDLLLSLPLNPAFFDVVGGSTMMVTCQMVDEQKTRSLQQPSGLIGLQFVYPDEDSMELMPGGTRVEVTEENLAVYVKLVTERMLCTHLARCFKAGFETVIAWDAMALFAAREIASLLTGNVVEPFTMEELEKNIKPGQDYQIDSLQITWLFEVLCDMNEDQRIEFLQFISGSVALPVGGLAELSPKLTVAKKLVQDGDLVLPSVATCTGYLKLPGYSSKEVLREKLLLAISEGRQGFLLA